jgi:hypothetical protein
MAGIVLLIMILAGYLLALSVSFQSPLMGFAVTLVISVLVWRILPITLELLNSGWEKGGTLRSIWGHLEPSMVDIQKLDDKREVEEFENAAAGEAPRRFSLVEKFNEEGINPHNEWEQWKSHLEKVQEDYNAEFYRVMGGLFCSAAFFTVSGLYIKEAENPSNFVMGLLLFPPMFVSFNLLTEHLGGVLKLREEVKLLKEWVAYWNEARHAYAAEIQRQQQNDKHT